MICGMADWEQPSTSMMQKAGDAGGTGSDGDLEVLRQELAKAFERIIALETRVQELEKAVRANRGLASGA
jgi:hypothetical protein